MKISKEDKIVEVANRCFGRKDIEHDEIAIDIEDEYFDMFLECVELYGYQEFLDLWILRNKHNNQYIYVRPDNNAIEFIEFLDKTKEPIFEALDGEFIYKCMMRDEDEIEEDCPQLYYIEFVNNG